MTPTTIFIIEKIVWYNWDNEKVSIFFFIEEK